MSPENRNKRDLPEVAAEILIEQHAMREEIAALRQEISESSAALRQEISESSAALRQEIRGSREDMVGLFNGMTNAILDAMNRGTDRYERTNQEVDHLKARVTKLENPATDAA